MTQDQQPNTAAWKCSDALHLGDRTVLDMECRGCRFRRLVLRDCQDAATVHDVRSGPCKCGAWH